MDRLIRAIGGDCFLEEVTDAARLEGAGGLDGFEFEVNVAGWLLAGIQTNREEQGSGHHPASRERAADRIHGVSIHGF